MRRLVFTVFLLAVAMGSGWLLGQQQKPTQPTPLGGLFSGTDVAVRVDSTRGDMLYGTVMVRLQDGEWREVMIGRPSGTVPLTSGR